MLGRKAVDKRDHRDGRDPGGDRPDRGPRPGGGDRFRKDRRDDRAAPAPPREILPAPGIQVSLVPAPEAIRLIGKEIHHEARVYPLFDVAKILLSERARCRAVFEAPDPLPFLWRGLLDESVFLTKEDALQHLWGSPLRQQFLEEETVETDPPKGNFTAVARCGISGEWLGPPNFHAYQPNLRRFHRERFPHLSFESYSAKVRTEKGEEAVNAWLATMTRKTRWRILGAGDEAWIEDETLAKRELAAKAFDTAFEEARCIEVSAGIPAAHLSPALMASLKQAGNHAKQHPAFLIPAVCKALESEHMPVFKRQGKLFTGPARPHPLPPDQVLAERPGIIVEWIRNNPPAKLEGLWKEVSPDGNGVPPAEYAADLYWLLQQGHILLHTDDTLVVQEVRPPTPQAQPAGKKNKKKKKGQPLPAESAAVESAADDFQASVALDAHPDTTEESSTETATEADAPSEPATSPEPAPEPLTPAEQGHPAEENPASLSAGVDESPAL